MTPTISANAAILENIWIQYGALGLLIAFLIILVVFLFRMNQKTIKKNRDERIAKDKSHRDEWDKLKAEMKEEREKHEKAMEGVVEKNTTMLAEVKGVLNSINNKQ